VLRYGQSVTAAPTDDELLSLANTLLQDLDPHLREPELLRETIAENRQFWVMLHEVYVAIRDRGSTD
jgi:hypothetical protein